MKTLFATGLVLLIGASDFTPKGLRVPDSTTDRQIFQQGVAWAERTFVLTPIRCPVKAFVTREGISEACYGTTETADTFRARADRALGRELTELTGWRDDYGVLDAAFEWNGNRRWEFSLLYKRHSAMWNINDELSALADQGYRGLVVVGVYQHRDREER